MTGDSNYVNPIISERPEHRSQTNNERSKTVIGQVRMPTSRPASQAGVMHYNQGVVLNDALNDEKVASRPVSQSGHRLVNEGVLAKQRGSRPATHAVIGASRGGIGASRGSMHGAMTPRSPSSREEQLTERENEVAERERRLLEREKILGEQLSEERELRLATRPTSRC